MLEGIKGVYAAMDGILVTGRDTELHDQILKRVEQRERNPEKLKD